MKYLINETSLKNLADTVRSKTGITNELSFSDIITAINSIKNTEDIGEFSANFNNSILSWMFIKGQTFEEFINSKYNSYGSVSNASIGLNAFLKATDSKVCIDGYEYYVINDGSTNVNPSDLIENNKQYSVVASI